MSTTLERWIGAHPFLLPVARFDDCLVRALEAHGAGPFVPEPAWDAALADLAAGVPLLQSRGGGLEAAPAVTQILSALVSSLAAEPALPATVRDGCRELDASFGSAPPKAAVSWLLSGGDHGEAPTQPDLVLALGWRAAARALAPVVAMFAERRDEARWGRGHCPTCGALPVMSWLVPGEGVRERQLACGLCGTRWTFQRVGCASCGNADSGRLAILEVGDEDGFRLDLCDDCKGYTKTWTGPGDPTFFLEDWTSLHLDVVAQERGYERKGASLYRL